MNQAALFRFFTERRLVQLTGRTARTLPEMLSELREIPGSSVFYHTHHLFLSHHFEKPVVYNDFANWVSGALQERALAEKLAAIDLREFTAIRPLRDAIIAAVEDHLSSNGGRIRECPPGDAFYFCKSMSFVMPTGIVAADAADFFRKLEGVTNVSLYFHFLEARLRLERRTNDFSEWLAGRGEHELAGEINRLDPYIVTLDELKMQMLELGRRHGYQ